MCLSFGYNHNWTGLQCTTYKMGNVFDESLVGFNLLHDVSKSGGVFMDKIFFNLF